MFIFSRIKSDLLATSLSKYNYALKTKDILAGQLIGLERKHSLIHIGLERSAILSSQRISLQTPQYPHQIFSIDDTGQFLVNFFQNFNHKILCSILDLSSSLRWERFKQLDLTNIIFYGSIKTDSLMESKKGKIYHYDDLSFFTPNLHLAKYYKRQKQNFSLLPLKVLEVKSFKNSYIVITSSRLAILEKQSVSLKLNEIYLSCVLNIKPFGIFVSINGIKCLLHISEIKNERIENIYSLYNIGDQIKVKIIYINTEQGKIAVSAKQVDPINS